MPIEELTPERGKSSEKLKKGSMTGFLKFDQIANLNEAAVKGSISSAELYQAYREGKITEAQLGKFGFSLAEAIELKNGIDHLTKLPNRSILEPRLASLKETLDFEDERRKYRLGSILVVAIDINKFKLFNEKPYNHAKGDEALVAVANRLKEFLTRDGDEAFRVGGDEFILVFPIDNNHDSAGNLYERIKANINKGLHVEGEKDKLDLLITANIGHTVVKKGDPRSVAQIIMDADISEREAKPE